MIINKLKILSVLELFTCYAMEDASDDEVRLSVFILTMLSYSPQSWTFVLKDEFIRGHESFSDSGKRTQITLGTGIKKKNIEKAIEEVNSRGLISIRSKDSDYFIVKLNHNYLQNAEIPSPLFS